MDAARVVEARYRGACVFGTASGLTIRGVGCLQESSRGLLRILDFGTQKLQRDEVAWFVLPYAVGGDHGKLIGQVGFASDFKGREGFVGFAVAVTDQALLRTGYSGPVYLIEKLFPWFMQNFDATQGDATFAQADNVLASLAVPPSLPAEVHQEEALRLKLRTGWQNHISPPELMGILPGYVQYAEIMRRGYVLRLSERAQCDKEISEAFLSTWRQELYGPKERQVLEFERARLTDALNQTVEAYKAQERFAAELKADVDGKARAIGNLEERVRVESADRARLTQALQAKTSEADAALQAKAKLESEQDRVKIQFGDAQRRLDDATKANDRLLAEYRTNQARLAEIDAQLKTVHETAASEARRQVAAEKNGLEARISEQQRVLTEAVATIQQLTIENADARVTIEANRQAEALPPRQQSNTGGGGHGPRSGSWNQSSPQPAAKRLKSVAESTGSGNSALTIAGICLAAAVLMSAAYAYSPPLPSIFGAGQKRDGDRQAGLLASENSNLREKIVEMTNEASKDRAAVKEAKDQLQREIDGWLAKEQNLRAMADNAKAEATRANEAALNALKEMERLKGRASPLPGPAGPTIGQASASTATGATSSILGATTSVAATPATSAAVPLNQRCGIDPAYRATVDFARHCSTSGNWTTQECQNREKRVDFAKLAVELGNCPKAVNSCGSPIGVVLRLDSERRSKNWNWHEPLAVAMDSVLLCVAEAWKRVPVE